MSKHILYRDFDLPTRHLGADNHFQPLDESVDHTSRGLAIAIQVLTVLQEQENIKFATRLLGAAAFNSAWYAYAQNADVMRRRLKLPVLTAQPRPSKLELIDKATKKFEVATYPASTLFSRTGLNLSNERRVRRSLGENIGNAALALAGAEVAEAAAALEINEVQTVVRASAEKTKYNSANLHLRVGEHPCLEALAYEDSLTSRYWRDQARRRNQLHICEALEEATCLPQT